MLSILRHYILLKFVEIASRYVFTVVNAEQGLQSHCNRFSYVNINIHHTYVHISTITLLATYLYDEHFSDKSGLNIL